MSEHNYIAMDLGQEIFMREYGFASSPICPYCKSKNYTPLDEEPNKLWWGGNNYMKAVCNDCHAPFTINAVVIPDYHSVPFCSQISFPCAMEYYQTTRSIYDDRIIHLYKCVICEKREWR